MILMDEHKLYQKAALLDHTNLAPHGSRADIQQLCREAGLYPFASVCVLPCWVSLASSLLGDSPCKVCTVVGFPLGANLLEVKAQEAKLAVLEGAGEVDMVINLAALKAGRAEYVQKEIFTIAQVCDKALLKVIIEACYLNDEEKALACRLALEGGADFVKTSTGLGQGGAVVEDVKLMAKEIGGRLGIKAAGGIRDAGTMEKMLKAGATRIGTSQALKILGEYQNS